MTTEALEEKIKNFPDQPGIYLMKNEQGKVIYVGKAKSLKKRVRSYFQKTDDGRVWSPFLAAHMADVDYIVTNTEKEAIILEDTAIKEHKPKYNIRLKDDKSFLRLKLTVQEEYPRLVVTRKVKRDGAMYFGPYSSAHAARETFRIINNYFMLRKCSNATFESCKRPCIYGAMGKCMGPCCGKADKETYAGLVHNVISFLQGKNDELLKTLRRQMQEASDRLDFELAAKYRDQIQAVERTVERQKVVAYDEIDRDVFGIWEENGSMNVTVLMVRKGKLVASQPYYFPEVQVPTEELLGSLLTQFYSRGESPPEEILLPLAPENLEGFEQWLSDKKRERVEIIIPKRGEKHRLLEMARLNAQTAFEEYKRAELAKVDVLDELQRALKLHHRPVRIEAFDMSNIMGELAVGSMVVFEGGRAKKSDYRKFKVRTVEGAPDDYAMMREVLTRHLTRAKAESSLPSLLMVDGGKGQLGVALSVLEDLQIAGQDVIGIAKEKILYRHKSEIATREADKIYIPHRKDPILLRPGSASLHLVQHIRDEAHRFAITYHKKLRAKRQTHSALDDIEGIGPRRRTTLLRRFGSIRKLAEATEREIAAVPGISPSLAQKIKQALSQTDGVAAANNREQAS